MLLRVDTNERLEILESRGTVATDMRGALREMVAIGAGARCKRGLYHASINVRIKERMTAEQWRAAIDRLEERLNLSGQPRIVAMHEKLGRAELAEAAEAADSLFGPLAERIGAAELTEVKRQAHNWSRKASEAFAQGRFRDGLEAFAGKGWISWSTKLADARAALLARYERDTAEERGRRFIFAYTNEEVRRLNDAVQQMEIERGRVTGISTFETSRGTLRVGEGDRVMIRGTDKKRGLLNGAVATVEKIEGETLSLRTDRGRRLQVDLQQFDEIELGYAGTIYRGQGRTLDQTYLLHTRHWRDASSYVALTRARESTQIFVAREEARDLSQLAAQMMRQNNRAATIVFEAESAAAEMQAEKASVRQASRREGREQE